MQITREEAVANVFGALTSQVPCYTGVTYGTYSRVGDKDEEVG